MARRSSTRSFARFASLGLLALGLAVAVRGEHGAEACGCCFPSIEEMTTFDPGVLDGSPDGLQYDPFIAGFGDGCTGDCTTAAMLEDWHRYLGNSVTAADWKKLLLDATASDLVAIDTRLGGKPVVEPPDFAQSSLWADPSAYPKLRAAIAIVALARRVEPFLTFVGAYQEDGTQAAVSPPPLKLVADARAVLAAAPDPFLAQRAAFQLQRVLFYQRDFAGVIALFDKTPALVTPSLDLRWRAHYYLAGALSHTGKLARANLELARVHANYPPLAGLAAKDFRPREEIDWRESLKLARDRREQTELWRLVGVRSDPYAAILEIDKLDPKSDLLGLLVVRELNRAESIVARSESSPNAAAVAGQKLELARLEKLVLGIASTPGADRVWLMKLVAGHLAAKRGDLTTARPLLLAAVAARPNDARVASQAKASLALALILDWKISPQHEDELARAMNGLSPDYGRLGTVRSAVRGTLAKAYAAAGKYVDAEFLMPGSVDELDESTGRPVHPKAKPKWSDVAFIKDMIARDGKQATEFDRFVLQANFTRPQLEQDLALRLLLDGDFTGAARTFETTPATSEQLHTDPFVIHTIDCHDCDHDKFTNAPWTHVMFAEKLVELQRIANGRGEPAAAAAFQLGNALYNITHYGNARVVTENSHQSTRDTRAAEHWYKRAFELSTDRELRAKAAFMAAKCELGMIYLRELDDGSPAASEPMAKTWFPIVKTFANTRYYQEALGECGYFRDWVAAHK